MQGQHEQKVLQELVFIRWLLIFIVAILALLGLAVAVAAWQ
jgi:hypothetical protein